MHDETDNPLSDRYVPPAFTGYVILSGTYISLPEMVQNHLRKGWVLQGGATPHGQSGQLRFYQAMFHPDFYEVD